MVHHRHQHSTLMHWSVDVFITEHGHRRPTGWEIYLMFAIDHSCDQVQALSIGRIICDQHINQVQNHNDYSNNVLEQLVKGNSITKTVGVLASYRIDHCHPKRHCTRRKTYPSILAFRTSSVRLRQVSHLAHHVTRWCSSNRAMCFVQHRLLMRCPQWGNVAFDDGSKRRLRRL